MENDKIDPRIKDELECLNSTSEKINQLENEICEKRNLYRTTLNESTQKLNHLSQKLGDCINKARPYYEARRSAKQALQETQQAALNFERAVSMHTAAREMVTVAEQGMTKDANREDTAWQEMLNHATIKVNEAEIERYNSEIDHQQRAQGFKMAEELVNKLEKKLRSNIKKSRHYFEIKQKTQKSLEELSEAVKLVERKLQDAKTSYSSALQNLESISDSIHASRCVSEHLSPHDARLPLGEREEGVGAETTPPMERAPEIRINDGIANEDGIQAVLQDLAKVDSVDHLTRVFDAASIDGWSVDSGSSYASSRATELSKDGGATSSPALMMKIDKEQSEASPSRSYEDNKNKITGGNSSSTSTSDVSSSSANASSAPSQTLPIDNSNKYTSHRHHILPVRPHQAKRNSGEILLTVAGLADVSLAQH